MSPAADPWSHLSGVQRRAEPTTKIPVCKAGLMCFFSGSSYDSDQKPGLRTTADNDRKRQTRLSKVMSPPDLHFREQAVEGVWRQ